MEEVGVVLIVDICTIKGKCFPFRDSFALFLILKYIRGPPIFRSLDLKTFKDWRI